MKNTGSPKGRGLGAPVAALSIAMLILVAAFVYVSFSPKLATSTSSTSAPSSSATGGSTSATSTNLSSTSYSTSSTSSVASATSSSSSSSEVTIFQSMPTSSAPKPQLGVLDPANGDIYRSNFDNGTVSVISNSTNTVVSTVRVGSVGVEPDTPVLDPQNGDIYVPNYASDSVSLGFVSVISGATNTIVANITVGGGGISGAVFDPTNGDIYLTSGWEGEVLIISGQTNTMVGSIPLNFGTQCDPFSENPPNIPCTQAQDGPSVPVLDPANGDFYVSNGGGNTVSVISGATNSLVTNVVVGGGSGTIINSANEVFSGGPGTPVIDSANGNIYVTHAFAVSVISSSTNAVIATVKVGDGPHQPVFNPVNGDIYVPNETQDVCEAAVCRLNSNLSIISGATNTILATVRICNYSSSAFSSNGDVYVPCQDGTVWVILSTTSQSSTTTSTTLASPGICGAPPDTMLNWTWEGNDYMKVVTDQGKVITNGTLVVNLVENDGDTSGYWVALGGANGTGYVPLASSVNVTSGHYNVTLVASYNNQGACYTATIPPIPVNLNSSVYVTVSIPSGVVTIVTSPEGSSTITTTTTTATTIKQNGG